jgi:hypothetical protein
VFFVLRASASGKSGLNREHPPVPFGGFPRLFASLPLWRDKLEDTVALGC